MTLYEAIYKRKSVRMFKRTPVDQALLNRILAYEKEVEALFPGFVCRADIVKESERRVRISGMFRVKAPYYLIVSAQDGELAYQKAGAVTEYLVLYMASRGLGTCYQGGCRVSGLDNGGLKVMMVVAFGQPGENSYRNPEKAKRLPFKDLCYVKEEVGEPIRVLLKSARLAPSSFNSQPWRFVVYHNRIHIFAKKEWGKKNRNMQEFNMGIVLTHLMLAAEELWMEAELKQVAPMAELALKNNRYITTLFVKE